MKLLSSPDLAKRLGLWFSCYVAAVFAAASVGTVLHALLLPLLSTSAPLAYNFSRNFIGDFGYRFVLFAVILLTIPPLWAATKLGTPARIVVVLAVSVSVCGYVGWQFRGYAASEPFAFGAAGAVGSIVWILLMRRFEGTRTTQSGTGIE